MRNRERIDAPWTYPRHFYPLSLFQSDDLSVQQNIFFPYDPIRVVVCPKN